MRQEFFMTKNLLRAAVVAAMAVLVSSCTQVSGLSQADLAAMSPEERVQAFQAEQKALQEKQKAMLAEQRAKMELQRKKVVAGKLVHTNTSALTTRIKPADIAKKKPRVKKASVSGNLRASANIKLNAPWKCVPNKLKSVLNEVSRKFGRVVVNSTHRSHRKNRRVGGARKSWHLHCKAVDFRVHGNTRGLYRFLRNHPHVGGLKRYRSGYYHIDVGPRRTW